MPEFVAYTPEQDKRIARAIRAAERPGLSNAVPNESSGDYRGCVRVVAASARDYNSRVPARCPAFTFNPRRTVFVIEQIGTALAGYIAVTVNGSRFVLECRRASLSDVAFPGCRATVLPGMWELDFGELADNAADSIEVEAGPITSDENLTLCEILDSASAYFTGLLVVRREAWVTVADRDAGTPPVAHAMVRDAIPFSDAQVSAGAVGLAVWHWAAGFVVLGWQCREFSHAAGYVQEEDPVTPDGGGLTGGDGGGGVTPEPGGGGGGGPVEGGGGAG